MRRRFNQEIVLIGIVLSLGLAWPALRGGFSGTGALVYDTLLPLAGSRASPDILIVAIDDASIAQLGRWPWSRTVHAQLLDAIAPAEPTAVLLDLFLTEPGDGDARLASAMQRVPTYLPLLRSATIDSSGGSPAHFVDPVGPLAQSARGLGHVELVADPDGVARRIYLRQGPADALRDYLGVAVAGQAPLRGGDDASRNGDWLLQAPLLVAYAHAQSYSMVSYVNVLRGEVPAELLRGRLVLVGATAGGLGDHVVIPRGASGAILSGVEVHANAIDNLRQHRSIRPAGALPELAWAWASLWLSAWLLLRRPRLGLPIALGMALACVALSAAAMAGRNWLNPVAALAGIAALYLLWSWRRLRWQLDSLREGSRDLEALPQASFEMARASEAPGRPEVSSARQSLDRAAQRLTHLQRLVDRAVLAMPVGILICDENAVVRTSNAAARQLLKDVLPAPADLEGQQGQVDWAAIAGSMQRPATAPAASKPAHPLAQMSGDYLTPSNHTLRVRATEVKPENSQEPGAFVVTLIDMTEERQAQRQREEWRRLLSHDLRSPQINILSLIALNEGGTAIENLLDSIRRESERTLSLAEAFMDVADAEFGNCAFAEVHVGSLLDDACDQVRGYAQKQDVQIQLRPGNAEDATALADGTLLCRAVVNLVNNAIRFSPAGGCILICAAVESSDLVLSVRDEGEGMDGARQEALIAGEGAVKGPRNPNSSNYGLGWEIVRSVVRRHGGILGGHSAPGAGCTFWMSLPVVVEDDPAQEAEDPGLRAGAP